MGWAVARGPEAPARAPPRAPSRAPPRARPGAGALGPPAPPWAWAGAAAILLAASAFGLPPSPGPPPAPGPRPLVAPAVPEDPDVPEGLPAVAEAQTDNVLHIAVALAGAQDQAMARIVHRTLANMTKEYLPVAGNVSVAPLLLSLPTGTAGAAGAGRGGGGAGGAAEESGTVIERLCALVAGRRVVAVLVVGGGPAALGAALAGVSARIPVLWLRGGGRHSTGFGYQELSPIEIRLEPGARQMVDALRALLVATHWHSFTLMADEAASTSVLLKADLAAVLRAPPLHPTFVHLRSSAAPHAIFSRLADVSRLTRGVVVLMCDERTARSVLAEGRRLNMVDGHFVWLWLDTRAQHEDPPPPPPPPPPPLTAPVSAGAAPSHLRPDDEEAAARAPRSVAAAAAAAAGAAPPAQQPSERRRGSGADDSDWHDMVGNEQGRGPDGQRQWQHTPRGSQAPPPPVMRHRGYWSGARAGGASPAEPPPFPLGMLTIRRQAMRLDRHAVKGGLRVIVEAMRRLGIGLGVGPYSSAMPTPADCWSVARGPPRLGLGPGPGLSAGLQRQFASFMAKELRLAAVQALAGRADWQEERPAKALASSFQILNLVREPGQVQARASPVLQQATHQTDEVVDAVDEEGEAVNGVWRGVGRVLGRVVDLDTIVWPGGDLVVPGLSVRARSVFRIVTALAPPFVMEAELDEDGQCLRGLPCHRLLTRGKDNLTLVFSELETQERLEEEAEEALPEDVVDVADYAQDAPGGPASTEATDGSAGGAGGAAGATTEQDAWPASGPGGGREHDMRYYMERRDSEEQFDLPRYKYRTNCCYGLAMDLLENIAHELEFDFHLYVVSDGVFGSQVHDHHHHHHHPQQPHQQQGQPQGQQNGQQNGQPNGQQNGQQHQPQTLPSQGAQSAEQTTHLPDSLQGMQSLQAHQRGKYTEQRKQRVDRSAGRQARGSSGFGTRHSKWNGIVGDLASGAAHMSFAALSVSSARSEVMDFSVPFFYSGVSFLAAPTQKSEIPLHAFLLPFSPELWIAIFLSLNFTALAVAVYEWLSPFGLNPWGRQRSKNFSIASALWVMWGLLCGHLVAFKAPKSWPNKFLINVWGGFSVLFVASYTANIAALIAGLFFHNAVSNYHDRSLLSQRVGAPRHSAADYYVHRANPHLWEHMQRYSVATVEEGVHRLRNGTLDILIADTPILDYYRATDHGCKLQKIGDAINEDTYAVGMTKGFPLKDSISAVIAKYTNNGYMDILQEKWYGGLPCFKLANDMVQPRPLGVAAVAGVFILLGLGVAVGVLILVVEHLFYRYTLPLLRHKPKGTIWKSRNIMFFSQKLYRFINCVELVSPHHAARELVHTLRQGQITSLFQKSVKRKEHEQRRRRKSKAQFFEMIQEIRRVQQEERAEGSALPGEDGADALSSPGDGPGGRHDGQRRRSKSPCASRLDIARRLSRELFSRSPKGGEDSGSRSSLSVRRFSSEAALSPRMLGAAVGRRLSKGNNSPPDLNSRRASHLDTVGKQAFNPLGASGAGGAGSAGSASRSAGRLFNGRNNGGGAAPAAAGGGLAGGSAAASGAGAGAALEPGAVCSVAVTPVKEASDDTLLEETEEDEEICKVTLDAAAAAASRRQPSKGSSSSGASSRTVRAAPGSGPTAPPSSDTLRRLPRDELLRLSRYSESELRDHLLRALREKDSAEPP